MPTMRASAFQNLPLFNDDDLEEADETLYLNQISLLDLVHRLKSSETLSVLRHAIADLKNQLRNPEHELRVDPNSDHAVEFSRNYLLDDLDQIAESQTI